MQNDTVKCGIGAVIVAFPVFRSGIQFHVSRVCNVVQLNAGIQKIRPGGLVPVSAVHNTDGSSQVVREGKAEPAFQQQKLKRAFIRQCGMPGTGPVP